MDGGDAPVYQALQELLGFIAPGNIFHPLRPEKPKDAGNMLSVCAPVEHGFGGDAPAVGQDDPSLAHLEPFREVGDASRYAHGLRFFDEFRGGRIELFSHPDEAQCPKLRYSLDGQGAYALRVICAGFRFEKWFEVHPCKATGRFDARLAYRTNL
jgi:hypothetical protein